MLLQVAYAEYELDAIMLTGSCTEYSPGKQLPPPKGLELNLGTEQQPHQVRTAHRPQKPPPTTAGGPAQLAAAMGHTPLTSIP